MEDGTSGDSINPLSSPSCHEKWKQARLKSSRTWTSNESSRTIVQIVSKYV